MSPVSRLFSDVDVVSTFAGPGGWCEGIRLAAPHLHARHLGVELDPTAYRTRAAAGHRTLRADVRALRPAELFAPARGRGLISSPPCPTFSNSGKRTGLRSGDLQAALDAITCLGIDCGCEWHGLPGRVEDIRTALVVEPMRWINELRPDWVILEQVPAVEIVWEDLAAELYSAGWEWVDVQVLDAADFGLPASRRRAILMAHTTRPGVFPRARFGPGTQRPYRTPRSVLGLDGTLGFARRNDRPDGLVYRARDMRSTDRPAFCVTEKVRSWSYVPADGSPRRPLTLAEVAQLQGFRADYPFAGSRTAQCLQAANAVPPLLAAQLLAGVLREPLDLDELLAAHTAAAVSALGLAA